MPERDDVVRADARADEERFAALDAYDILDTAPEQGFEDITLLASRICETPVALVSLVDRDRQWFKARIGFPECETDLDSSVCKYALAEPDLLVIPDLTLDARTTATPLVTGEPFIRFYAGAPLRTPGGVTIGSLCVIDTAPRPAGLTESQRESLRALARQVITLLELRRKGAAQTRAAEVQRENEVRQSGALRIAQLGTYEWELATGVVKLDARSREIFGFADGEETTAQEVFGRIHPEDFPSIHATAMASTVSGEPLKADYRIRLPDGEIRNVASQGDFLRGSDGRAERGIGVFADVTERVRAEASLRESEARYRTLFESIDVGFCIIEMKFDDADRAIDYRIMEANPAFERQTGAKVEGLWVSEFAPNLERYWLDAYGRVALTGEPEHFENRADVFARWFDVRALRVGDPAAHRVAIFFNDITAGKSMEDALRQLNDTLEQQVQQRTQERDRLWRNTQDLQLVIDLEGIIKAINPAFTAVLGWTTDDTIGRNVFEFIVDDNAASQGALEHVRHENLPRFENRYRHRDGGSRWLSWVAAPEEGLIYASGRHITAEKEQAEALRQAEEALRQSQKMEAVGQLTGGLAHDFNNLLAGISGSLELMQTRMQQGRLTDVDKYMVAAQGASKRAAALTHRLLAFSRRQTLDPKPTDVNRLIGGMQEMIQRTVGPGIPVEVVGASGVWPALVDPPQLENALLNLCINARDAMPEGGRITVETANRWMDERAARQHDMPEGQYLVLSVTDTGIGMPPNVIARVFEPFFTTKPIGEGTGLGLSMIYGFAQQSGGQVRIYSEVGLGTTVSIYLPRHYGELADDVDVVQLAELPRSEQGETVLIVDDEPTVRMLVNDILEDLGYTAIEAGDSAAGLKVLQSDVRIDLLITDVGLPGGMNGRQMADASRVSRPDLRVLFITGYAENALLGNGHLAPGMAVLTKPFAIETMAARIRSMIEAGREARRKRRG